MSSNHYHKGTPGKPRAGLEGSAAFDLYPTLVTPLTGTLGGGASFTFGGLLSPGVAITQVPAEGTLVLDNYDVLSASFRGRAAPIQNVSVQSEVAWFLDNVGGGTECCDISGGTSGGSEFLDTPDNVDDLGTTYFYFGWLSVSGDWLVRRQLRATAATLDATSQNNPTYATLTQAWPNRSSLIYA